MPQFLNVAFHQQPPSRRSIWRSLSLGLGWGLIAWTAAAASSAAEATRVAELPHLQFNADIRPILAATCWKCHGPGTQEAGLRLDLPDRVGQPAESGLVAIVPGQPAASEAVRRILSTDPAEMMPPPAAHKELSADQKERLVQWVAAGAVYQKHWSFEPPQQAPLPQPLLPALPDNAATANPVDTFLRARQQAEGLSPAAEASRERLIRRVALALTGLPPSLGELETYLADAAPDAYERMVDRYLASPHFGEEMARHWLDVARYADTHGLHLDNERQMWAYRDWVIEAFNQNQPFDQFTIEQLAGDLLPDATLSQQVATGFLRCNVTTGEGGSIDEEWVFRNALDRTSTVAEAWLGLTMGCSVCHDHKFDPISARDYYSLYAFFHSAADPPLDGNVLLTGPTVRLLTPEITGRLADLDRKLAEAQVRLDVQTRDLVYADPADATPPPAAMEVEHVWFDDEFPAGGTAIASPGHPPLYVTADQGPVHSGQRALKRVDAGLAQDVYEGKTPLDIPAEGRLFAHVWISAQDPPRTVMLQYYKNGWLHRAVWGDYDAIDWGQRGTTERVDQGALPTPDSWQRLEVAAATLGLNAGDQVTGFAFTQFGGTVFWDKAGVVGRTDPAGDPRQSFLAWWRQRAGQDTPEVPADLQATLKTDPEPQPTGSGKDSEPGQRLRDYYLQQVCTSTRPLLAATLEEMKALKQSRADLDASVAGSFVFNDLPAPRESFVMLRGQYNKPGEKVLPGVPAVLPPLVGLAAEQRATRLDLARWLVSRENPLTARVTVNRFWQQFFGQGLVRTSFDFGTQGTPPSHPELLDWLAVWFRDGGWDVKGLVRLLVTSATFRQNSAGTPEQWARDPGNRWLARGPRFRLDAEQIRDNSLFVSGLLNPARGGRGDRPYQPPNIWEPVGFVGSNTATYTQDHGAALYRRSVYAFLKRTAPPPFMANFDAPNRESFCTLRERSNTPLQALQLMNDVQHFEAARALAERMLGEGGSTAAQRVTWAYRVVLSRRPTPRETQVVEDLLAKQCARYAQDPAAAQAAITHGETPPRKDLDAAELAAYTLAANLLLNLDETLNRN